MRRFDLFEEKGLLSQFQDAIELSRQEKREKKDINDVPTEGFDTGPRIDYAT